MRREDDAVQFLHLSEEGERRLKGGAKYTDFDAKTTVIHKGQSVSGAYLVTRGRLRVYTFTPQGNEATLYFIGSGETCVLALNCLFNNLRYPAWVESEPGTRVALIPGPVYRRLFQSETSVQDMTVQALSTLVFRLMGELEQIHACNLDQRLAHFLLEHASGAGTLAITQRELAAHLGTSREVIARLMQGFTKQGWVSTSRGVVTLRDSAGFAAQFTPGDK